MEFVLKSIFKIKNILKSSPMHIPQPKCGRTKAEKRRQQKTLAEIERLPFLLLKMAIGETSSSRDMKVISSIVFNDNYI
jgi:hypothetical protein